VDNLPCCIRYRLVSHFSVSVFFISSVVEYALRLFEARRFRRFSMFKDHFSDRSGNYLRYRPSYPDALFAFLAEISPTRRRVWDCATGSGQAAQGLATHFERVIATDASAAQIGSAVPAANVDYRVAPAEASGLPDHSVDLVTVAQALHWLDLERFYDEVRRALEPGGLLAAWSYNLLRTDPAIDAQVDAFYSHTVGPYWPPERRWIENGYCDLPFPFPELDTPPFAMTAQWRLEQLLGYLGTWSATKRYRSERGTDPLETVRPGVRAAWGDPAQTRIFYWPLALRIGALL